MAVSKRLRYEVLRRDNHACRYCGATAPDVVLTVDHVVATALGGSDDPSNLVAACSDCNSGKSATPAGAPLIADVEQDALRWAAAMQHVTQLAQLDRQARYATAEAFSEHWADAVGTRMPFDWETTIGRYCESGLIAADLLEASAIAGNNRTIPWSAKWRYFCGICNNMLRRRQEASASLMRADREPPPSDWRSSPDARFGAEQHLLLASVCDAARETI